MARALMNFFLGSLLLHGLLFCVLVFYFLTLPGLQITPHPYLRTYMHESDEKKTTQASSQLLSAHKDSGIVLKKVKALKPAKNNQPVKKVNDRVYSHKPIITSRNAAYPTREILLKLHAAIAAKQSYPESALELKQKGTVKIGFSLYPDGQLKNITLLKSSGFDEIDRAALNAVHAISPATAIARSLKTAEFFSVDIVFE